MDELIKTLSQKTGRSEDKAHIAVDVVANYLKSKLPASLASQVENALTGGGFLGKKSA